MAAFTSNFRVISPKFREMDENVLDDIPGANNHSPVPMRPSLCV